MLSFVPMEIYLNILINYLQALSIDITKLHKLSCHRLHDVCVVRSCTINHILDHSSISFCCTEVFQVSIVWKVHNKSLYTNTQHFTMGIDHLWCIIVIQPLVPEKQHCILDYSVTIVWHLICGYCHFTQPQTSDFMLKECLFGIYEFH
jgi:hypothetical protein